MGSRLTADAERLRQSARRHDEAAAALADVARLAAQIGVGVADAFLDVGIASIQRAAEEASGLAAKHHRKADQVDRFDRDPLAAARLGGFAGWVGSAFAATAGHRVLVTRYVFGLDGGPVPAVPPTGKAAARWRKQVRSRLQRLHDAPRTNTSGSDDIEDALVGLARILANSPPSVAAAWFEALGPQTLERVVDAVRSIGTDEARRDVLGRLRLAFAAASRSWRDQAPFVGELLDHGRTRWAVANLVTEATDPAFLRRLARTVLRPGDDEARPRTPLLAGAPAWAAYTEGLVADVLSRVPRVALDALLADHAALAIAGLVESVEAFGDAIRVYDARAPYRGALTAMYAAALAAERDADAGADAGAPLLSAIMEKLRRERHVVAGAEPVLVELFRVHLRSFAAQELEGRALPGAPAGLASHDIDVLHRAVWPSEPARRALVGVALAGVSDAYRGADPLGIGTQSPVNHADNELFRVAALALANHVIESTMQRSGSDALGDVARRMVFVSIVALAANVVSAITKGVMAGSTAAIGSGLPMVEGLVEGDLAARLQGAVLTAEDQQTALAVLLVVAAARRVPSPFSPDDLAMIELDLATIGVQQSMDVATLLRLLLPLLAHQGDNGRLVALTRLASRWHALGAAPDYAARGIKRADDAANARW